MDWTARVDAKASFAFAIESAAIATVVALTAKGRLFSELNQWWLFILYFIGLALLLLAAALAALVVAPRLRTRKAKDEATENFIYFGHVRNWDAGDLATALERERIVPQISAQIVRMAKIAWTKHIRVQWSFRAAIVGGLVLVFCGLLRSFS